MTEEKDEYNIGKPIDDDYIGVEKRRADISSVTEECSSEESDNLERRTEQSSDISNLFFDMSHIFDDSGGSGASSDIDELIDENAIIEHDGRAETRTFYYPSEAPETKQHRFTRMLRWQEGERSPERDIKNNAADLRRWVSIFCTTVELGDYQTERTESIAEGLNMKHMAHYSTEEVILGIMSLVANEDGRFVRDESEFKQLVISIGSDMYTVKKVRSLVRRKSDII